MLGWSLHCYHAIGLILLVPCIITDLLNVVMKRGVLRDCADLFPTSVQPLSALDYLLDEY